MLKKIAALGDPKNDEYIWGNGNTGVAFFVVDEETSRSVNLAAILQEGGQRLDGLENRLSGKVTLGDRLIIRFRVVNGGAELMRYGVGS